MNADDLFLATLDDLDARLELGAGSTGSIWLNSTDAYCDSNTNTTTGTFRADAGDGTNDGCWSPYVPAVQFKASS